MAIKKQDVNTANNPGFQEPPDINEILKMQLGPYYDGVSKGMKEAGYNHATEAIQQGQNPMQMIGTMLMMTGQGLQGKDPTELLKNLTVQNKTKGVYGYDPSKGTVSLQAEVPANADIRNMTPQSGLETLPIDLQPRAYALARKIGGVRGAEKALPSIIENLKSGKNIDQIEDEIRLSGQSSEFSGPVRDAAQSISVDKSESQRNVAFDALDDYIQRGDVGGAKDYLKRMSLTSAPADQRTRIMGKERTVEFLDEIKGDLNNLEANGIDTGFFAGNYENLLARVGQVKEPELRKVATKVAVAMMNYRRDMTGVQFGEREGREYKILFPNINKVGKFNTAAITGLQEAFNGDVSKFYSQSMGSKNYEKIFGKAEEQSQEQSNGWNQDKEARYQELLKKRGK